uniref:Uncharacterized protein n=1 Tax=Arundo donax TaxID=35708 RepID=A0A0A9GA22_ARUDO
MFSIIWNMFSLLNLQTPYPFVCTNLRTHDLRIFVSLLHGCLITETVLHTCCTNLYQLTRLKLKSQSLLASSLLAAWDFSSTALQSTK